MPMAERHVSKRRRPGDVVWKPSGAGFSSLAGWGMIPEGSEPQPCLLCDDPDCQEWPDLWPCTPDGQPTGGNWCHVSECEMLDRPDAAGVERIDG